MNSAVARSGEQPGACVSNYWSLALSGGDMRDLKPLVTPAYWRSAGGVEAESTRGPVPREPDYRFPKAASHELAQVGNLAISIAEIEFHPAFLQAWHDGPGISSPPTSRQSLAHILLTESGSLMDCGSTNSLGQAITVLNRIDGQWLVNLEYVYSPAVPSSPAQLLSLVAAEAPAQTKAQRGERYRTPNALDYFLRRGPTPLLALGASIIAVIAVLAVRPTNRSRLLLLLAVSLIPIALGFVGYGMGIAHVNQGAEAFLATSPAPEQIAIMKAHAETGRRIAMDPLRVGALLSAIPTVLLALRRARKCEQCNRP